MNDQLKQDGPERFAVGCMAIVFGAPALWLGWMVRKFADGDEWFDVIVRFLIGDSSLAIGLFAAVSLVWAIFAPAWLTPFVNWAATHMAMAVYLTILLLVGSLFLFIIVYAILDTVGIKF